MNNMELRCGARPWSIVEFQVTGDYALFTPPYLSVHGEKCSYQIPTYGSIEGILRSVYWKPTFEWVIDSVRVMNRICYQRMSELIPGYTSVIPGKKTERHLYTCLVKPCYQVRAHMEWNLNRPEYDNDRKFEKHIEIAERAIEYGGRMSPFMGVSNFPAIVTPCVFGSGKGKYDNSGIMDDFGIMFHSSVYADQAFDDETKNAKTNLFWKARMENGYINFPRKEECQYRKHVRNMRMKKFEPKEDETLISPKRLIREGSIKIINEDELDLLMGS